MSTRLTEHLITYGLSNAAVNALADGGYWNLDKLLAAVEEWKPHSKSTANSTGLKLYEHLNVTGFGPVFNAELLHALDNRRLGMPQPWAPNERSAALAEEIVRDIHDGKIQHGDPLTPASHLVVSKGISTNTAVTVHRLLASRGYLAMRDRRPIALLPGSPDYTVEYCPSISEERRGKAASAVALLRSQPGLWRRARLCHGIKDALRPLDTVRFDDARRTMWVLVLAWRS